MAIRLFAKSKNVPEKKSAIPLGVVGFTGPSHANWSGRSAFALTRSGYLNNPIAFRCVKLVAEACANIDLIVQDETARYDAHPLLELLKMPNADQTCASFFEALYSQLVLTGDGFVEAVIDDEGVPRSLHVLRSDRMRVRIGKDGWPTGYEYRVGKQAIKYKIEDDFSSILHLKSFHPHDDHYGLSTMLAAGNAIDVHNSASQWSKALLDNAARPSGAIIYKGVDGDGTMSDEQFSRLAEEIESNHQGARNAGRPMLLEGGLDWKQMGFSPSDMEFHRTKEAAAREIALALGVPPMLLGLPGDNTYANYQEANRAFFRLTVLPLVQNTSAHVSNWLRKTAIGEGGAQIKVNMDSIPALSSEREAEWRRISSADFLTQSEKRKLLGFPAQQEGD